MLKEKKNTFIVMKPFLLFASSPLWLIQYIVVLCPNIYYYLWKTLSQNCLPSVSQKSVLCFTVKDSLVYKYVDGELHHVEIGTKILIIITYLWLFWYQTL